MITSFINFLKTKHLYLGLVRYSLGIVMLTYSLTKIFNVQFAISGFSWTQIQTLESMGGKQLAWAFLGYSKWFQILLGLLEFAPALLLFFRRTTLLGAILMLPMTLNVAIINYALDLWDGTKAISLSLLFLNVLIFVFEWNRIKPLFLQIIAKKSNAKSNITELIFNIVIIATVSYFGLQQLLKYVNQTNELTGDWTSQRPIEWILEREECKDSVLTNRDLKIYFWAYGRYDEIGNDEISPMSYTIDDQKKQLSLKYQDGKIIKCNYSLPSADELKIEIIKNNSEIIQHFRKRVINENRN